MNNDIVNHPPHYKSKGGLEVIDVIEAFTYGLEGIEATDTGNIIKYICRWKKKNGIEDLKKAQWYLNHLLEHANKKHEDSIKLCGVPIEELNLELTEPMQKRLLNENQIILERENI